MAAPFVYDADLLARGIKVYYKVDLDRHPHLLCVGATSSGKTYALTLFLGKLAKYEPGVQIVICDYKKSGFGWLDRCSGFYGYTKAVEGIANVYSEFEARLEANDTKRNARRVVLLIDEYAAMLASLDKKSSEEVKRKVGAMLMAGRSLGIHIVIGVQRADAEHFRAGARDQFGAVLMLGNLSKEQKAMLAPDYAQEMTALNEQGQGYLLLDGKGLFHVQVPHVVDMDKLYRTVAEHITQPTPPDGAGEA